MDPLTHTAIGFLAGRAVGARRWTSNWAWVMVFGANAPDSDSVARFLGREVLLEWHRHFTHALAFAPLMALATVVGVRFVLRRPVQWWGALGVALLGVVAHDLTDLLTYRGTRILLPFSDAYYALGIESFFDPVLYTLLGLAFVVPFLSNLVSGEIGARQASGRASACVVLVLIGAWWSTRYVLRQEAMGELASRVYLGEAPRRYDVYPSWQPLEFVALVEGRAFQKLTDLRLMRDFDAEGGQTYFRQVPSEAAGVALRKAGGTRTAQIFLAWARWPRSVVTRYDGETRWVVLMEELAVEKHLTRPRVIVKLDERYRIQSEEYERAKNSLGL
ncbi:MAG: metal-dependent hydrolase [Acidobacteriota bacterium]